MTSSGGPFAAALIDATRRAWAASAGARLREHGASVTDELERAGVRDTAGFLEGLLEHLSVALHFGAPALFLDHVEWMATAFRTRELKAAALSAGLDALERELESRLPSHALPAVTELLAQAGARSARP